MMMKDDDYVDFFSFSCDFETVETTRKLNLYFYPRDNSLELYDTSIKRILLKRTITETTLNDIYIGAKLVIYGRKIVIRGYGNHTTEQKMNKMKQRTFILVKPEARQFIGEIISAIEHRKLLIRNLKMLKLQALTAVKFLNQRHTPENKINALLENLTSSSIVVAEIIGENAYEKVKNICGPCNFEEAKSKYPSSLIALYGFDDVRCGVLISDNFSMNQHDLDFFFPLSSNDQWKVQAKFSKSTLCIIKPHAIKEGIAGDIIKMIVENGFSITAMNMIKMTRTQCENFYEIYKGIEGINYTSMVAQLQSGVCLAMEVQGSDDNTQRNFRSLCGLDPDPAISKILRPKTIRAIYGTDKILNAVHCTDLLDDTLLELEFIFKNFE